MHKLRWNNWSAVCSAGLLVGSAPHNGTVAAKHDCHSRSRRPRRPAHRHQERRQRLPGRRHRPSACSPGAPRTRPRARGRGVPGSMRDAPRRPRSRRLRVHRQPHPRLQPHPPHGHRLRRRQRRHPVHARTPATVTSSPARDTTDATYAQHLLPRRRDRRAPATTGWASTPASTAELTATTRTGSGRFTYPAGKPAVAARPHRQLRGRQHRRARSRIDAADPHRHRLGHQRQLLRLPRHRRPPQLLHPLLHRPLRPRLHSTGTWQDGTLRPGTDPATGGTTYGTDGCARRGQGLRRLRHLRPRAAQTVNVRVGISYVSQANAAANLARREPGRDRPSTRYAARPHDAWNAELWTASRSSGGTDPQQHHLLHRALPRPAAPERLQRRRRPVHRHGPARCTRSPAASTPSTAPSPAGTSTAARSSC